MLSDILLPDVVLERRGHYLESILPVNSDALTANAICFGNEAWAREYLDSCHRDAHFRRRWLAAVGDWTGKVVIDLGCGPGNVYATLGGQPKLLIGVDVAAGSLELAALVGYIAVLADVAHTPFRSRVADIVAINATLHHCDDMKAVLEEGARLVKPDGLLITDHDPQLTAWDYRGPALLLWNMRLWVYRAMGRGLHKTRNRQSWMQRSAIHHRPGDGVTKELFESALGPLGFEVSVHAHNHRAGARVLHGEAGPMQWKYRMGCLLSGRDPEAPSSALSLMCIARRTGAKNPEAG